MPSRPLKLPRRLVAPLPLLLAVVALAAVATSGLTPSISSTDAPPAETHAAIGAHHPNDAVLATVPVGARPIVGDQQREDLGGPGWSSLVIGGFLAAAVAFGLAARAVLGFSRSPSPRFEFRFPGLSRAPPVAHLS